MQELSVSFASGTVVSSALRGLRQQAGGRRTWLLLAVISIVVGMAGPFGTFVDLGLPERLAYWSLAVTGTFFLAGLSLSVTDGLLARRRPGAAIRLGIGAAIAGAPIAGFVLGLGYLFGLGGSDVAVVYANSVAICFGVSLVFLLCGERRVAAPPPPPTILGRLPPAKRGHLIRLFVCDHYVEIVTDKGRGLALMRLMDAIAETPPEPGLRVHRSHWVAVQAVTGCRRSQGRLFLKTLDGACVPVSRNALKQVREAGLDR